MNDRPEIALVIQDISDFDQIDHHQYAMEGSSDFVFYYNYLLKNAMEKAGFDSPDRIYYGSEFCENALPEAESFLLVARECKRRGLDFTVLTPPVSDAGLKKIRRIVKMLNSENLVFEVVVNDLGVLKILSEIPGSYSLALGRIMDKRPHDPRLSRMEYSSYLSENGSELLGKPGILSDSSIEVLHRMNINAVELDEPIHSYSDKQGNDNKSDQKNRIRTILHLPYGFLTTGRLCIFKQASLTCSSFSLKNQNSPFESTMQWNKTADQNKREHEWRPDSKGCRRLCQQINQILTKPANYLARDSEGWRISNTALFRKGNTLFYPVEELLDVRLKEYDRLVFHLRLSV